VIATIGKTYSFDAAHQLPNHDGKCARPHGHTYSVTVEVRGEIVEAHGAPDEGMVLDYFLLGEVWKKLEPDLDHRDLNESIGDECWPTTAENIAAYLFRRFAEELFLLAVGVEVVAVTVCETPKTFARVQAANG
jgi:6-pyruvoyltetrahydropterin/6-carboxytetrahydropterin synthase